MYAHLRSALILLYILNVCTPRACYSCGVIVYDNVLELCDSNMCTIYSVPVVVTLVQQLQLQLQ
jgi:hypothetical protein